MNIEDIQPYEETFLLVHELKRLVLTEQTRTEVLLERFNENGKHKVSSSFDTQSSFVRLDELVKEESKKRGISAPTRDSLTVFLKEGRLYQALTEFDSKLLKHALSNDVVVRQALGNVLPKKFVTYKRMNSTDFEGFLKSVTKNSQVTEDAYDILSLHHNELQREVENVKEIQQFLDYMESFYDYREAQMQMFVKKNFELFYNN